MPRLDRAEEAEEMWRCKAKCKGKGKGKGGRREEGKRDDDAEKIHRWRSASMSSAFCRRQSKRGARCNNESTKQGSAASV